MLNLQQLCTEVRMRRHQEERQRQQLQQRQQILQQNQQNQQHVAEGVGMQMQQRQQLLQQNQQSQQQNLVEGVGLGMQTQQQRFNKGSSVNMPYHAARTIPSVSPSPLAGQVSKCWIGSGRRCCRMATRNGDAFLFCVCGRVLVQLSVCM